MSIRAALLNASQLKFTSITVLNLMDVIREAKRMNIYDNWMYNKTSDCYYIRLTSGILEVHEYGGLEC